MGKRELVIGRGTGNRFYVQRSTRTGRFQSWTKMGKSLSADRRKYRPNPKWRVGYGHQGDKRRKR